MAEIAGVPVPDPVPEYVSVSVADLRVLAGFGCEWVARGADLCEESKGLCQGCWVARWAQKKLEEIGE